MTFQEALASRIAQIAKGTVPESAQSFWGVLDRAIQYWLTAPEQPPTGNTLIDHVARTVVAYKTGPLKTPEPEDGSGVLTVVSVDPILGLLQNGLVVDVFATGHTIVGVQYEYTCIGGVYSISAGDKDYGTELFQEDFTGLPTATFICKPHSGASAAIPFFSRDKELLPISKLVWDIDGRGWGAKDIPLGSGIQPYLFLPPAARAVSIPKDSGEIKMIPNYSGFFGNIDWKSSKTLGIVLTWKGPPTRSFAIDKFMDIEGLTWSYATMTYMGEEIPLYTCFWPELYYQGSVLVQAPDNCWMLGAGVKKLSTGPLVLVAVVFSRIQGGSGLELKLSLLARPFSRSSYNGYKDSLHPTGWSLLASRSAAIPTVPWCFSEDCNSAYSLDGDTIVTAAIVETGNFVSGSLSSKSNTTIKRTQTLVEENSIIPGPDLPPLYSNGACRLYNEDDDEVTGLDNSNKSSSSHSFYTCKTKGKHVIAVDSGGILTTLEVDDLDESTSNLDVIEYSSFARVLFDVAEDTALVLSGWDLENPPGDELSLSGGYTSCEPTVYSLAVSCGTWRQISNTGVWVAEDLSDCRCADKITVIASGTNDRGVVNLTKEWIRPGTEEPRPLAIYCRKNQWVATGGKSPYWFEVYDREANSWFTVDSEDLQPCEITASCPDEPTIYRVSDASNACRQESDKQYVEFMSIVRPDPPPPPLRITGPATFTTEQDYRAEGGIPPYHWVYDPLCTGGTVSVHCCPRGVDSFWYSAILEVKKDGMWLSNNDRCCIAPSSVPSSIAHRVFCDEYNCHGASIEIENTLYYYSMWPSWLPNLYAAACNNCGPEGTVTLETFRWACL